MKVDFANLNRDEKETYFDGGSIDERIKKNVLDVIARKNFILGDYVEKFEKAFADYCGAKHCIGVSNGLSALEFSLIAIGIKKDDEVITVANTFNATVAAIAKTGAKPVLVDANSSDFNVDAEEILKNINDKTKAIIPVHLYGQTCDMKKLPENIPIIEDACQAHGSKYDDKRAGNLGLIGCFSFYPGKNLGCYGDGGAIVTDNDDIANFLRMTRNYGQTKKYHHDIRPDNSRLDTIHAAVLIEKLNVLDEWNGMRRINACIYRNNLRGIKEIKVPTERKEGEHVYHLFVIQAKDRENLAKYLEGKGIQTGMHYPVPIHLQKCFSYLGYKEGDFPVSEELSKKILTLPMFPTMRKEEIDYTCEEIKKFYS